MPWPSSLVLLSAIAAATTRLRLGGLAVLAPLRHPLFLAKRARDARPPLGGQAGRSADGELAPRRVRGARSAVRASAGGSSTSTSPPGRCSGATQAGVASPASTTASTTSGSSRSRGVPTGRGSGSAARRCILACCGGSCATRMGSTHSGAQRRRTCETLEEGLAAAGRNARRARARRWDAARVPRRHSPSPLEPAIAQIPALWARGFTTFCIKPNQYLDDSDASRRGARRSSSGSGRSAQERMTGRPELGERDHRRAARRRSVSALRPHAARGAGLLRPGRRALARHPLGRRRVRHLAPRAVRLGREPVAARTGRWAGRASSCSTASRRRSSGRCSIRRSARAWSRRRRPT